MVCSSDDIAGQGLQGVDPGADIDGPRAAVVDDQHGRATRDRLGRPGKIRLGTAANPEDDFTWALNAAGGNGDNADGANQGFVPGHDQPLLTMPDCGQHTLSPADTSLTWAWSRAGRRRAQRLAGQAKRGNLPAEEPRARRSSSVSGSRPVPLSAAVTSSQESGSGVPRSPASTRRTRAREPGSGSGAPGRSTVRSR